jgi:hypothetical protein
LKQSRQEVRTEAELRDALARSFAGVSAPRERVPSRVVWQDGPDEVLVHVDSISLRLERGAVVVGVDLESEETGRGTVVVVVAVGTGPDSRGPFALTEATARGEPLLAARYGSAVSSAVWNALLALSPAPNPIRADLQSSLATLLTLAADRLRSCEPEHAEAPGGIAVVDGQLHFYAGGRERGGK